MKEETEGIRTWEGKTYFLLIQLDDLNGSQKIMLDRFMTKTMSMIKSECSDRPIWMGLDGTSDTKDRFVANVLLGNLDSQSYHSPYLVTDDFMKNAPKASDM
ncbi:unnamed protein product [Lepeophtheirus salmonis]|uniref:(salmon louse) hypothetical protein n=1 Tax=Lepeophtheirus salmonis TaxID=72036 RepID=A0A7R8CD87_LEPSM|nr:unnamed protein product [Lepeophtheirus salmonis]CAF2778762.1 unnamed protein product [Lepeophtheirus salmonis]